jgi:hypothetical protein
MSANSNLAPIPNFRREPLEVLYRQITTNPSVGASVYGNIRSHLINRSTSTYSWGKSKAAGAPDFAATNAISGAPGGYPNDWAQPNFRVNQPIKVTQFTNNGLNYAKQTLKLDNTPYRG